MSTGRELTLSQNLTLYIQTGSHRLRGWLLIGRFSVWLQNSTHWLANSFPNRYCVMPDISFCSNPTMECYHLVHVFSNVFHLIDIKSKSAQFCLILMKAHSGSVILRSKIEMVKLKQESDQICRLRYISRISEYKIILTQNLQKYYLTLYCCCWSRWDW